MHWVYCTFRNNGGLSSIILWAYVFLFACIHTYQEIPGAQIGTYCTSEEACGCMCKNAWRIFVGSSHIICLPAEGIYSAQLWCTIFHERRLCTVLLSLLSPSRWSRDGCRCTTPDFISIHGACHKALFHSLGLLLFNHTHAHSAINVLKNVIPWSVIFINATFLQQGSSK